MLYRGLFTMQHMKLCAIGGIGRRTRLRIWRATVGVQVPYRAPRRSKQSLLRFFLAEKVSRLRRGCSFSAESHACCGYALAKAGIMMFSYDTNFSRYSALSALKTPRLYCIFAKFYKNTLVKLIHAEISGFFHFLLTYN